VHVLWEQQWHRELGSGTGGRASETKGKVREITGGRQVRVREMDEEIKIEGKE
jgi:hypothetical protein